MVLELSERRGIVARRKWRGFWRLFRIAKRTADCGQDSLAITETFQQLGYPWSWCQLTDVYHYDSLEFQASLTPEQRNDSRRNFANFKRMAKSLTAV